MQSPPETAGGTGGDLRSDAKQLSSTATNRLHSEVDARKGSAATQAKSVSSAIERAGSELDEGAPDWLRSAFRQGAEKIQQFADTIEQKDSRQLVNDVSAFARSNPGTFLAGCAAAGFAAARIFKAGGPDTAAGQSQYGASAQASPRPFSADEPMIGAPRSGALPASRGEFA